MDYLLGVVGPKRSAEDSLATSVQETVKVPSYRKHHRPHQGEKEVHKRQDVPDRVAESLADFVTDDIPEEHVAFLRSLKYLALTTMDADGRPWISLLVGEPPSFIDVLGPNQLRVRATLVHGDPLADCVRTDDHCGPARMLRHFAALAVSFETRMRGKIAGVIHDVSWSATELDLHLVVNECVTPTPKADPNQNQAHQDEGNGALDSQVLGCVQVPWELPQVHNATDPLCGAARPPACPAPRLPHGVALHPR